jgi:hypothetical protein
MLLTAEPLACPTYSKLDLYHIGLHTMKQIFWGYQGGKALIFIALACFLGCAGGQGAHEEERVYKIIGPGIKEMENEPVVWSRGQLESLGTEEVSSAYFDKALGYKDSKFHVVSLSKLVTHFDPEGLGDAVLLNCFDDYQGILSVEDIKRYNIHLATRIEVRSEFNKPDWLNPLLIIVPDEKKAPFQERYLTANIRELRFAKLEDYYAPLLKVAGPPPQTGFSAFKDNCLSCHSLMGVGGNKGVQLMERYDFSHADGKERFRKDFSAFHHKDNPDKQNVEQFVSETQVEAITLFLRRVKDSQINVKSTY